MNERILDLAVKSGHIVGELPLNANEKIQLAGLEKFAELIVRKCADIARAHTLEKYPGMKSDYDGIVYVEEAIKQHFGVAE